MREHPRIVTHLPLDTLWDQNGRETPAVKQRALTGQDIKDLWGAGGVRFVVADGGYPLRWIAHDEVFTFWKHEVQPHLIWGNIAPRVAYPKTIEQCSMFRQPFLSKPCSTTLDGHSVTPTLTVYVDTSIPNPG